jgi:hypothetical protein
MTTTCAPFLVLDYQDARWLEFINAQPEAHLFHHPAWIGLIARCYKYRPFVAVVMDDQGLITAGLPIIETNNLFNMHRWVSLPYTDYCNPLYKDFESLKALEKGIIQEANLKKVSDVELRWDYPFPNIFHSEEFVLIKTKLCQDPKEIASQIKGNALRNINVATKRGVEVEKGTSLRHLEIFYQLHTETRRRLGVPVQPWHYFQMLRENLLLNGMGNIFLAQRNGEYVSGAVYLNWKHTLIYKYAASNMLGRELCASAPLIWNAICWGCENGLTVLDWGRTDMTNKGLRHFKNQWSTEEIPLIYSTTHKNNGVGLGAKMMPVIKKIINSSPSWLCRLTGELLYPYFG